MQLITLVSLTGLLAGVTSAADYTTPPAYPSPSTTSKRGCDVITATKDPYECEKKLDNCTVLACLEIKPVTLRCGCSTISTTRTCPTACPTSCGATSYITAVEDCFPTPPPSSSTLSPPTYPTTTTTTVYRNTTTTTAKPPPGTETITLTVCPKSTTCTGQTVTYTSTEACPTTTCTCVLPGGPSPPPPPPPPPPKPTTTQPGNTPPRPSATPIQANVAAGWGVQMGAGAMGLVALVVALL